MNKKHYKYRIRENSLAELLLGFLVGGITVAILTFVGLMV